MRTLPQDSLRTHVPVSPEKRLLVHRLALAAATLVLWATCSATRGEGAEFSREVFFAHAIARNEPIWQAVIKGDAPDDRGIRWLYNYALLLAASGQHPARVDRLVQLGESMQERDTTSPTLGNFRWYFRNAAVTDLNAVEFVSHHTLQLWIDHRETLGDMARASLERTLRRSVDGCLRHKVHPSYTNIAISNGVNLILLGERFDRPGALREGLRRLDAICVTSWQYGICEYDSPTYFGVILDELVLLDKYVQSERGRAVGRVLLELFWTDIAVNWFAPGGHLAGTHSRSYNYPCGASDFLDRHLFHLGWTNQTFDDWLAQRFLDSPERRFLDGVALLDAVPGPYRPSAKLREIMARGYPREVFQRFGSRRAQWRRHTVYPDITLGCSGKAYGVMDLPLTVSLPGERTESRCYFIADGREDPYGKRRISLGSVGHTKALHLAPLWAAAAGGRQALAVALYPDRVLAQSNLTNLQSHFVLRRPDAVYHCGKLRTVDRQNSLVMTTQETLILRYGSAGLAVRIPWATTPGPAGAKVHLVDDGNPHNVLRLTVEHMGGQSLEEVRAVIEKRQVEQNDRPMPGVAIAVRIASRLDKASFQDWLRHASLLEFEVNPEAMRFASTERGQTVRLDIDRPWEDGRKVRVTPEPLDGILSLNGKELGREILRPVVGAQGPRAE